MILLGSTRNIVSHLLSSRRQVVWPGVRDNDLYNSDEDPDPGQYFSYFWSNYTDPDSGGNTACTERIHICLASPVLYQCCFGQNMFQLIVFCAITSTALYSLNGRGLFKKYIITFMGVRIGLTRYKEKSRILWFFVKVWRVYTNRCKCVLAETKLVDNNEALVSQVTVIFTRG